MPGLIAGNPLGKHPPSTYTHSLTEMVLLYPIIGEASPPKRLNAEFM